MMRVVLPLCIASWLLACAAVHSPPSTESNRAVEISDPIERLIGRLSDSYGLWRNGVFPVLGLSSIASTQKLISRVFEMTGFDRGRVTQHQILETRQVSIPGDLPDIYTAVLVDTNLGKKIVLMKFEGPAGGWWSRVYDAETSA
jgi:hypothetical protein